MNFNAMKKMIGFFVLASLVTVVVVPVAAQGTEFPPLIGPESPLTDLLAWTDLVYSAIVILLGYVSNYIPGLNKMAPAWRVVSIGLIVAAMFVLMGSSNAFSLLFSYLAATNFYELILKFIVPESLSGKRVSDEARGKE
jgi:uncharacterized BrkB/YihY/UPF0761 family membrane protein